MNTHLRWLPLVLLTMTMQTPATAQSADWRKYMTEAESAIKQRDSALAESALNSAIKAAENTPDNIALARSLTALGSVRIQQSKLQDAYELFNRALGVYEKQLGPDSPDVEVELKNVAETAIALGKYDDARTALERILKINENSKSPSESVKAIMLSRLAGVYAAQSNLMQAEALAKQSMTLGEKVFPGDDLRLANILASAAVTFCLEGKVDESVNRNNPDNLVKDLQEYAKLLRRTKRSAEAEKMESRAAGLKNAKEKPAEASTQH